MYQCKCGKQFEKVQSLHGHQSMCRIHLGEERWAKRQKICQDTMRSIVRTQVEDRIFKEQEELNKWISEEHRCEMCNKIMTEKYASGRFCSVSCSKAYSALSNNKQRSENLSKAIIRSIEEGTHNNWSRSKNRGNYIERYWNFVLSHVYKLKTEIQYKVKCSSIETNNHYYYLDILVNSNIDLEIDGPFHDEERDKRRDEYLTSKGYIVYRVPYINPRRHREQVLEQIKTFVDYANTLQNK